MKRLVTNVNRLAPTLAVCNLSDGTIYEVRGDADHVDRQVEKYLKNGIVPDAKDCFDPKPYIANVFPQQPAGPSPFREEIDPNGDPAEMMMPTINWKTGQIERNGKPIPERPIVRESMPLFLLNQEPAINGLSEENEPPYLMPKLDFSDRHATHQPGKPVERQHGGGTTYVANGSEEAEEPYVRPTLDFSDRLAKS